MKSIYYTIFFAILVSCKQNENRDFFPVAESTSQIFHITSNRDTTLVGEKGSILKLKANSFLTNHEKEINGKIEIEIKEFYTIEDFINNRLSTSTVDGKVLRSSGMLFIEAKSNGEALKLKDDHPMTIIFKRVQDSKKANLFRGEKGKLDEVRWALLEPVHNDTIVVKKETIKRLNFGEENIYVELLFVIGEDTISLSPDNKIAFNSILNRMKTNGESLDTYRQRWKYQGPSIGDSSIYHTYISDSNRLYVFQTTDLGYLNCDIFIDTELYPFSVTLDNNDSDVFVVLDTLNSVVFPNSINKNTNEFIFTIPKNVSISIIAYRKSGDKHYLGIERRKTDFKNIFVKQIDKPLDKIRSDVKRVSQNAR